MKKIWVLSASQRSLLAWVASVGLVSLLLSDARMAYATPSLSIGSCDFRISKLNVAQRGAENGTLEFVEVRVNPPTHTGQTFGDCGVTEIAFVNGSGTCETKASIALDHEAIPATGIAVLGSDASTLSPDATTGTKGSWLENGPDYLVIKRQSTTLAVLAYANTAGTYPSCQPKNFSGEVSKLPADPDVAAKGETMVVQCPEGYRVVAYDDPSFPLRQPNQCNETARGGAGGADGHDPSAAGGAAGHAGTGGMAGAAVVRWHDAAAGGNTQSAPRALATVGGAGGHDLSPSPPSADVAPPAGCSFRSADNDAVRGAGVVLVALACAIRRRRLSRSLCW